MNVIHEPYKEHNMNIINEHIIYIFTDGSIQNGLGGYGIYYEYQPILSIDGINIQERKSIDTVSKFIGHSSDINYIELKVIYQHIILNI